MKKRPSKRASRAISAARRRRRRAPAARLRQLGHGTCADYGQRRRRDSPFPDMSRRACAPGCPARRPAYNRGHFRCTTRQPHDASQPVHLQGLRHPRHRRPRRSTRPSPSSSAAPSAPRRAPRARRPSPSAATAACPGPALVAALIRGLRGDRRRRDRHRRGHHADAVLRRHARAGCTSGIQVTGSHNPKDYNGFKMVLAGRAIYGDEIQALRRTHGGRRLRAGGRGSVRQHRRAAPSTAQRIVGDIKLARPMKIVVDSRQRHRRRLGARPSCARSAAR